MKSKIKNESDAFTWIRSYFQSQRCDKCKRGEPCGCTRKDAKAYLEAPDGTRRYFCYMGCLLLLLDDENLKHAIESEFNSEGHYEKLQSFVDDYIKAGDTD